MNTRTRFLTFITILLFLLVLLFAYYFFLITRPFDVKTRALEPLGIKHLFSIYGISKTDTLQKPNGVTFDKEGNIYVADTGNDRLLKFDDSGNFLKKFEAKKKMRSPLSIQVGPNKNIYASSMLSSKMFVFSPGGTLIKEKLMEKPIVFKIQNSKIYITSPGRIWVYDMQLNVLEYWGNPGKRTGEFMYPNGIAIDKDENVYVSDSNNTRIQVFNKERENIERGTGRTPKGLNDRNRELGLPMGLTFGFKDYLYLIDAFHFNIKVFNKYGKQLAKLGDRGEGSGYFKYPSDISYDKENRFAVADKYNNRVQVIEVTVK